MLVHEIVGMADTFAGAKTIQGRDGSTWRTSPATGKCDPDLILFGIRARGASTAAVPTIP